MTYAGTVAADHPLYWFRFKEQAANHPSMGSAVSYLSELNYQCEAGWTGVASDGGGLLNQAGLLTWSWFGGALPAVSVEVWTTMLAGAATGAPLDLFVYHGSSPTEFLLNVSAPTGGATEQEYWGFASPDVHVPLGTWKHLVISVGPTAQAIYADGVLMTSSAAAVTFPPNELLLRVGAARPTNGPCGIAELAIYDQALSQAQAQAHHNAADHNRAPTFTQSLLSCG